MRKQRAGSLDCSYDDRFNAKTDQDRKFDYWYPSWETWEFRKTLSYWVAILFIEGSVLFVLGASFAMSELSKIDHNVYNALVATPYLVGGIAFTVGAYAGTL